MKLFLALTCLVVFLLDEVSAKPAPQFLDQARELLEKAKEKVQDALEQAQEIASRAMVTARNAIHNGFGTASQAAQSELDFGEYSTQNDSQTVENDAKS